MNLIPTTSKDKKLKDKLVSLKFDYVSEKD